MQHENHHGFLAIKRLQDSQSALNKRNNQTASTVRRIDATLAMLSFFALKISE
jgi:hypothetical protein